MTRITVLGASGKTGQEVVRQALTAGHEVTALVRDPVRLPISDPKLRLIVGDARDKETIRQTLVGSDGVISCLGRPESGHTHNEIDDSEVVTVCLDSTRHLYELGPSLGVNRFLLMSTHGAGTSNDGSPYVVWLLDLVGQRVKDKDDMEAFVRASDAPVLTTVVRNPRIYDGPSAPYDVYETIELNRTSQITYGDLAGFAINELLNPKHVGQFLTITEPLLEETAETLATAGEHRGPAAKD
jgi:uncharacterized protein YbjT (DUF2867 family)